ncbi:hypothetical protein ACHAQH_003488 [Verticillium albo-atrum]
MRFSPRLVVILLGLTSIPSQTNAQNARKPMPYKVQRPPLDTPWTYEVGTDPWPEHPRPQLVREAWHSLNGIWTYQPAQDKGGVKFLPEGPLEREVLIPSCIESGLSGLQELNVTHMWFATTFEVPADWELQDVLLHFEAVDYEAKIFVNGESVGSHVGGYSRFSLDVTRHVRREGVNELLVFVHDPTDVKPHVIPVGKQSKNPRHICISTGTIDGVPRPLLNGEFIFQFGTLDQGYWPDGLYTPPNRDALVYDLRVLKSLGFNMVRKHIKIEPDLFYHACDELGLMVVQDMPSLPPDDAGTGLPDAAQQEEFQRQIETIVKQHKNFPSIFTWVIYNEGWGQPRSPPWPEEKLFDAIRGLDSTRLINAASGWYDHGFGDVADNHHYTGPQCGVPPYDNRRVSLQGEFGGIGHNVSIEHLWDVKQAIDGIDETYEIVKDLKAYNKRSGDLLHELKAQIEQHACSGGVWTQTTDVEGEVNGLLTYDRRILRPNIGQWRSDIGALYEAAKARARNE